jgi:hypothetical protein
MTYRGHVKNGQITLDDAVTLPDGVAVNVEVIERQDKISSTEPTIWAKLLELAGTVEGPEDWAKNHDHYLYGTPKLNSPSTT